MKFSDYLSKVFNEDLNFNINDDNNPTNRIVFITIGNTGLKLRIDLKNKKILNGGIEFNKDKKNIKFNQYNGFWKYFGIDTPIDYDDFLSKIKNIIQNNNINNLINDLFEKYKTTDKDNKYSEFVLNNEFKIIKIK